MMPDYTKAPLNAGENETTIGLEGNPLAAEPGMPYPGPSGAFAPSIRPYGWACPVCGRGVAPSEKMCEHGGGSHFGMEARSKAIAMPKPASDDEGVRPEYLGAK